MSKIVFARAKINLTLDILGLRPDGFHQVETVMQSIGLHDVLEFAPRKAGIELTVTGGTVSAGKDNLVYRAAELMQRESYGKMGISILLKKNIPVEAGLGGGSADAAATLKALNELWAVHLSPSDLLRLGQQLGSDVPFCLLGGTALASGRGELLEPLKPCPPLGVVLVKPPWGASTAAIYQAYDNMPNEIKPDLAGMIQGIREKSPEAIAAKLANVLETPVFSMYPEMAGIKERLLNAGALGVLMSGSGSSVFGITKHIQEAYQVAERFSSHGEVVLVTETVI
jgi:4-diphosphocytidyl-2-C-methyl-D-erythritol kinase